MTLHYSKKIKEFRLSEKLETHLDVRELACESHYILRLRAPCKRALTLTVNYSIIYLITDNRLGVLQ